jgi:3-oxoacyl-[acyl-carrier protein] reductase
MNGLKGKKILITGAGFGLGRAAAIRFGAEGAKVLVNDLREDYAEETCRLVKEAGGDADSFCWDVASHQKTQAVFDAIIEEHGHIDILVNNAGILKDGMLHKLTEGEFDSVIQVNLKGVFNCAQAYIKAAKKSEVGGSIVNVSSIAYLGNIGQTNYAAAKAGVVAMTRTWAMELARYGVRVNAVAPGLMDTTMVQSIPEELIESMKKRIPLRRVGSPEEFASAVCYLASDDASYITGQVLHLDGGITAGGL